MVASYSQSVARPPFRDFASAWRGTLKTAIAGIILFAVAGCATTAAPKAGPQSYSFWPEFPDEPRIQFLTSYRYSSDVTPPRSGFDELIFGKEQRVLPINMPYGVAMWNGRIYICDIRNAALLCLDLRNQQMRVLGTSGTVRFASPTDVAVTPDGIKYVSDARRAAIFVFDEQDRHVHTFSVRGTKPTGIAIHENELFIGDLENQQVIVYDRHSGVEVRRIGDKGDQDGQFVWPLGVDVDRHGNVFVADALRCRVQKFDRNGQFIRGWGETGDALGCFVRPKLLTVDSDGIVYVVDAAFQNVQMFDGTSDDPPLLMFFGGAGSYPGAMMLPVGVNIHDGDLDLFADQIHPGFKAERLILVTNQFGPNRISVYAFGRLRDGYTARDISGSAIQFDAFQSEPTDLSGLSASEMDGPIDDDPVLAPDQQDGALPDNLPIHLIKPLPEPDTEGP